MATVVSFVAAILWASVQARQRERGRMRYLDWLLLNLQAFAAGIVGSAQTTKNANYVLEIQTSHANMTWLLCS